MPNIKSKIRHVRTSERNRKRNFEAKASLRTVCKKLDALVSSGETVNSDILSTHLSRLYKIADKASKNNILKKNKVSRLKSLYSRRVSAFVSSSKEEKTETADATEGKDAEPVLSSGD